MANVCLGDIYTRLGLIGANDYPVVASYVFTNSKSVTFYHNLHTIALSMVVLDEDNQRMEPSSILYVSINEVVLDFSGKSVSGKVYAIGSAGYGSTEETVASGYSMLDVYQRLAKINPDNAIPFVLSINTYETIPASTWVLPHNKNTRAVEVTVVNNDGVVLKPSNLDYSDPDYIILSFGTAITGIARLLGVENQ